MHSRSSNSLVDVRVSVTWGPKQKNYTICVCAYMYKITYIYMIIYIYIYIYIIIYIYNQPRYLRMSVFPIMQLNSNATPLRICPHFVLICFLPIWPLLWKPLYTSMQPVSAFFSSSFHILIQFSCQLRGHPGNPCIGGPGASFNPKPRLALETRHLWGAPFAAAKKAIL